jgi:hypothetical protein
LARRSIAEVPSQCFFFLDIKRLNTSGDPLPLNEGVDASEQDEPLAANVDGLKLVIIFQQFENLCMPDSKHCFRSGHGNRQRL